MPDGESRLAATYRTLIENAGQALALAGSAIAIGGKPFRSTADSQAVANAVVALAEVAAGAATAAAANYPSRVLLSQALDGQLSLVRSALGLVTATLNSVEAREKARVNQAIGNATDMIAAAGRQAQADAALSSGLDGIVARLAEEFRQIEAAWQAPAPAPAPSPAPAPAPGPAPGPAPEPPDTDESAVRRFESWLESLGPTPPQD